MFGSAFMGRMLPTQRGPTCSWGISMCCAAGLDIIPYVSLLRTPMLLRGSEPGVSAYVMRSTGARFMCRTGDSASPSRPLALWAFDDGGLEFASMVEADPLGAERSTIRR